MTIPDLAAFRALVEAALVIAPRQPRLAHAMKCGCSDPAHRDGWDEARIDEIREWKASIGPSALAAREVLEWMETDCVARSAYDAVCAGNSVQASRLSDLRARLARLEEALRVAKRTIRTWSEMGAREPEECLDETWLLYQESPEMKQINTVLEGRDE